MTPGRIKLAGEIWTAPPYDEHLIIEPGETVEVLQIKGATASSTRSLARVLSDASTPLGGQGLATVNPKEHS